MEGLKILTIDVTAQALSTVLETALDAGHTHGIGYWARVEATACVMLEGGKDGKREERIAWARLFDHQGAGATDSAHDSAYRQQPGQYLDVKPGFVVVNVLHIKRAIEAMLRDPEGTASKGWTHRIVSEEYPDGPLADAIVQVACFGKVIYG